MFNNYNLFKYGQTVTGGRSSVKRMSVEVPENGNSHGDYVSLNKYKNRKEREKDEGLLKDRLLSMRN